MSYNGGMLPEFHGDLELAKQTYSFLKKALLKVEKSKPFRGPLSFREGKFYYSNSPIGDITDFNGIEHITQFIGMNRDVFRQRYLGGLIIH